MSNNATETHVIFGTGPLGMATMRGLVNMGKKVRMINRSGKAEVPNGVEVVKGDAYNPANVRDVTKDAAVVYQCAQPAYTEWAEKFPPLQASILEGIAASGAKLVVGDNLYMYGAVTSAMTESLPNNPNSKKGRVRAAMAESVMEAHEKGKIQAAIGRGADFFGAGVTGSAVGDRVFPQAIAGKKVMILGDLDAPHTYTYINDFGKGLAILGTHDEAFGQLWHVPSAETLTSRQFVTLVFEEAGKQPNIGQMGKMMLRIGGLFIPEAREVIEMTYQFEKPFVVDHSKFARAFGDHATPHRQAIRETITWYREHHQAGKH